MMPAWAGTYLQLPFLERGRSRAGLDCYGLVCQVFQEQRQIMLPHYTEHYLTTQDKEEITAIYQGAMHTHWREIPVREAQCFDVVIMRILGDPIHFGLVLEPPCFLHIRQGIWSCIERWDSLIWKRRLVAVARWSL